MRKFFITMCVLTMFSFCLVGCNTEPMTDEEYAAYVAARTQEYEVVSVYQYMDIQTNNFGAVLDQDLKYCFTYIGYDGQLHQFDDFEHTEYGLWKLCIGDENKYVVQELGLDTYRYLYLTKETLANMETR